MLLKLLLLFWVIFSSVATFARVPHFASVETQDPGIGAWQEMPFGQMRLLSCTSGVKDLPMVVGGLQVRLNPGWVMKRPDLKPLSTRNPVWIENPITPGDGQNPQYQGEVLFPLIYARPFSEKTDFELGVQGNFPVCQGEKCMTLPVRIGLNLTSEEADYTRACPYLIQRQRQVPLPATMLGIKGFAWVQGDEIQMAFSGLDKTNVAFLKTTQTHPFQVLETQVEKTGVLMRVKASPWALGTGQDWILITNQGIFKVPVQMQSTPIVLPPAPPKKTIWFLGWELFFLTPLFIWWGLGIARTNKLWKKEIIRFVLLLPAAFILKGLITLWFPLDFTGYALVVLGAVCLFPPVRKESALGMLLIWPYFPEIPQMSISQTFLWGVIMLIEVMIPFAVLYAKADEIGKILRDLKKKSFFAYNLIFLIPTLVLLINAVWQIYNETAVFFNELNPNGLTVVCPQKEQGTWKKDARLIAPDSVLGESLQKMYARKKVMIWQDKNGRLILKPEISKKKAQEAIADWQNYHAVNTP